MNNGSCSTLDGTIHTTAKGLDIEYESKTQKYYVTDGINWFYLCKWNNREKLFKFYRSNESQFMSYVDFCKSYCKSVGRKEPMFL